jgi:hypothetical protein
MKEKLVEYREGSFVDFNNEDHYFVVCAILYEETNGSTLIRTLQFGVSFCNPIDKNNNALGKKIAYGKATVCRDGNMLAGRAGLLNLLNVRAIIDNEVNHVKSYPESYSISYAKARAKAKGID